MLRSAQPSQFSTYPIQNIDIPDLAVLIISTVVSTTVFLASSVAGSRHHVSLVITQLDTGGAALYCTV